jgi:transcriptional regulator with XRE-family HTH domain
MKIASQKLKFYRKKKKLNIEEICLSSGLEYSLISDWELGKNEDISRAQIDSLIKVLNCRDTDILRG